MNTAKYTAGPWSVNHETDITGIENDPANGCVGLVDVAHVYLRTVPGRTEANARLIAAAPDLLDALRTIVANASSVQIDPQWAVQVARNAIAKATGAQA